MSLNQDRKCLECALFLNGCKGKAKGVDCVSFTPRKDKDVRNN